MLVIKRKRGEVVMIGPVRIRVGRMGAGSVSLAIEAPREFRITREPYHETNITAKIAKAAKRPENGPGNKRRTQCQEHGKGVSSTRGR